MTQKTLQAAREVDNARDAFMEISKMRDVAVQFRNDLIDVGAGSIAVQAADHKVAELEEPLKKANDLLKEKFDVYQAAVNEAFPPEKEKDWSLV